MDKMVPIFHSLSKSLYNIQKNSCEDISVVQSSILYQIDKHTKASMQKVAETVGMDITTFSRQIGTLEKKEYVTRTPLEEDRRINILSLTRKGKDVVVAMNDRISLTLEKEFSSLSEFEREIVKLSMSLMAKKLRKGD
ncbi:MarR family winged helix-turn-helix transcriptional regulator [Sporosarcina sp. CAU 1771]